MTGRCHVCGPAPHTPDSKCFLSSVDSPDDCCTPLTFPKTPDDVCPYFSCPQGILQPGVGPHHPHGEVRLSALARTQVQAVGTPGAWSWARGGRGGQFSKCVSLRWNPVPPDVVQDVSFLSFFFLESADAQLRAAQGARFCFSGRREFAVGLVLLLFLFFVGPGLLCRCPVLSAGDTMGAILCCSLERDEILV